MCYRTKGSHYEPPSLDACDAVLTKLDALAPDGYPTKEQWEEAIEAVHGDPREEGDKYDNDPRV